MQKRAKESKRAPHIKNANNHVSNNQVWKLANNVRDKFLHRGFCTSGTRISGRILDVRILGSNFFLGPQKNLPSRSSPPLPKFNQKSGKINSESNMHQVEVHHFASPFAPNFPVVIECFRGWHRGGRQFHFIFAALRTLFFVQQNDRGRTSRVFGKPCLCPLPKRGHFDENGENDEFAFYPLKTRVWLLKPPKTTKMTKMAGVTQEKTWFRKGRVCSSLK